MNIFDELKMISLSMKCVNLGMFNDSKVTRTWNDAEGNASAEIIITNNNNTKSTIIGVIKEGNLIIVIPLSEVTGF